MRNEKMPGQYCRFRKEYVPVRIRYFPGNRREKICGRSDCTNTKCILSDGFTGNASRGRDYLGEKED